MTPSSALLIGCAVLLGTSNPERGTPDCCTSDSTALELQYLGTGGWLLRYGSSELLTAPLFSNPRVAATAFAPIATDTARVDRALDQLRPLGRVSGILVGHSHYDHLMDVPYLLRRKATRAHVYGSATMANILAATPGLDPGRVHAIEDSAGTVDRVGRWVTVTGARIRFMPLRADHASHFQGIEVYEGEVSEPLDVLPGTARDWLGGATLAYLIDFLEPDGTVAFRIHYLDSATRWPGAAAPAFSQPDDRRVGPDDRRVDVQILSAPSYGEVNAYPEGLVQANAPRFALVGHWEDFFSPWTTSPKRSVRGSNLDGFTARLARALPEGSQWTLPNPGDVVRIPRGRSVRVK